MVSIKGNIEESQIPKSNTKSFKMFAIIPWGPSCCLINFCAACEDFKNEAITWVFQENKNDMMK